MTGIDKLIHMVNQIARNLVRSFVGLAPDWSVSRRAG